MARILIGVSGGIAAYKSIELARLATLAGHGVRVVMTEAATRFVGPPTFEGITGAPGPDRRVRARPGARRLSGRSGSRARSDLAPGARRRTPTSCVVAPASANTIAKLAAGICDSMLTTSFLADRRAAAGRARDERPHVGRRGDPGERRDPARARRRGARARRGPARLAGRARARAGCRSRARSSTRSRPTRLPASPPGPGTACACWSPPAAPASRSTRSASSATARAGAWASRSPRRAARRGADGDPRRRQRRDRDAPRRSSGSTSRAPPSSPPRRARPSPARRPADGRGRRPTSGRSSAAEGKIAREGSGGDRACDLEATEDILAGLAAPAPARPDPGRVRRRARRRTSSSGRASKLERKGVDAIVVNDVSRSRRSASTRPTTR